MTRLERLVAQLERRLLVTDLVNIRYLTGFDSSNAALLVEPAGAVILYTDFRYLEQAQAVAGVTAELTKRSLMADLAGRLKGTLAFEASCLPYSQYETLRAGGLSSSPRPASSRRCARSRTPRRSR